MKKLLTLIFLLLPIIFSSGYSPVYIQRQAYVSCSRLKLRDDLHTSTLETSNDVTPATFYFQAQASCEVCIDIAADEEFSSSKRQSIKTPVLRSINILEFYHFPPATFVNFNAAKWFASSSNRYLVFQTFRI